MSSENRAPISLEVPAPQHYEGNVEVFHKLTHILIKAEPQFLSVTHINHLNQKDHDRLLHTLVDEGRDVPIVPHISWRTSTPKTVASRLESYQDAAIKRILISPPRRPLTKLQRMGGAESDIKSAVSLIRLARGAGDFTIGVVLHPHGRQSSPEEPKTMEYWEREYLPMARELDEADFGVTDAQQKMKRYQLLLEYMSLCGIEKPIIPAMDPPDLNIDRKLRSGIVGIGRRVLKKGAGLHLYTADNPRQTTNFVDRLSNELLKY